MDSNLLMLIAAVVVGAIVLAVVQIRAKQEAKRKLALDDVAESLGLVYSEVADGVLDGVPELPLFIIRSRRGVANLLEGEYEGLSVHIFDFTYFSSIGTNPAPTSQTVVMMRSPQLRLPDFALQPEGVFDKIEAAVGFQDVDFDSHPEFSKRYRLCGHDEEAIRAAFGPGILSGLESTWGLHVEGSGDTMIVYRPRQNLSADAIPAFLAQGVWLAKEFLV